MWRSLWKVDDLVGDNVKETKFNNYIETGGRVE